MTEPQHFNKVEPANTLSEALTVPRPPKPNRKWALLAIIVPMYIFFLVSKAKIAYHVVFTEFGCFGDCVNLTTYVIRTHYALEVLAYIVIPIGGVLLLLGFKSNNLYKIISGFILLVASIAMITLESTSFARAIVNLFL